jgi:FMN phosphatase YigB (HAD superfamily)
MAVKSLLLDIDGVIVRDKLLLAHVKENCVRYVQAKLPECKDPRNVNRVLYLTHGHTARGLTHSFGIDTSDFNEKVYDKSVLDHLAEVIYSADFQAEAKEVHDFSQKGWNVTLFSNAPEVWCRQVARAIGDEVYLRCPAMDGPFKPDAAAYENFSKVQTHVFVDDSLKNIGAARSLPNWHPIHFEDSGASTVDVLAPTHRPWCPTIGSIWELGLFLDTADFLMDRHEPKNCPYSSSPHQ